MPRMGVCIAPGGPGGRAVGTKIRKGGRHGSMYGARALGEAGGEQEGQARACLDTSREVDRKARREVAELVARIAREEVAFVLMEQMHGEGETVRGRREPAHVCRTWRTRDAERRRAG